MADVKVEWNTELMEGDFLFSDNDLEMDEGLGTAVLISLFTDQRVTDEDDLPDPNGDKKGWWGDLIDPAEEGDQIGSKLWLLSRSKITNDVLQKAEEYALEALEWLKKDGIASNIEVDATEERKINGDQLNLEVRIYKTEENVEVFEFDNLWGASLLGPAAPIDSFTALAGLGTEWIVFGDSSTFIEVR